MNNEKATALLAALNDFLISDECAKSDRNVLRVNIFKRWLISNFLNNSNHSTDDDGLQ